MMGALPFGSAPSHLSDASSQLSLQSASPSGPSHGSPALPEQVPVTTTDAWFLDWWTRRWGPSAAPLLWSHAMVVLARSKLG